MPSVLPVSVDTAPDRGALPRIVDGLEAAGYDLVTLDELVGS